jgi:hypothetical protein
VLLRRESTSARTDTPLRNRSTIASAISWSSMNHIAMSMLCVSVRM